MKVIATQPKLVEQVHEAIVSEISAGKLGLGGNDFHLQSIEFERERMYHRRSFFFGWLRASSQSVMPGASTDCALPPTKVPMWPPGTESSA